MTDTVRSTAELLTYLHPNIQNAMPDATVAQSQFTRDLIVSINAQLSFVIVVDGVNYAQTSAGINAAVTAANTAGGGVVVVPGGLGAIAANVTMKSNVDLVVMPGTSLKFLTSSTTSPIIVSNATFFPTSGAATGLTNLGVFTATVNMGLTEGTLNTVGAGANLATGDLVAIRKSVGAGNDACYQVMKVRSVVGDLITFYTSFAYSYTVALFEVWKIDTPVSNWSFTGKITNPDGNDDTAAICIGGGDHVRITGCDFEAAIVSRFSYDIEIAHNKGRSDFGLPNGANYTFDMYESSTVNVHDNIASVIASDFSFREFHCTDVIVHSNQWGTGGRLQTHDSSRRIKSWGNRGFNSGALTSTGLTFALTDPEAGFRPGYARFENSTYQNSDQNLVAFAEVVLNTGWQHVWLNNCDFTLGIGANDIAIDTGNTQFHLNYCQRSTISIAATSAVYITDDTWLSWVPTIVQSGAPTFAVSMANYRWQGDAVEFDVVLTITAVGAAAPANAVVVSLPITCNSVWASVAAVMKGGAGYIYDSSATTFHAMTPFVASTTTMQFIPSKDAAVGVVGVDGFAAALAVNDLVKFSGKYKVYA